MTIHLATYTFLRGKTLVQCSCGWNGGKHVKYAKAQNAWLEHERRAA